jgi:hypothetical protein
MYIIMEHSIIMGFRADDWIFGVNDDLEIKIKSLDDFKIIFEILKEFLKIKSEKEYYIFLKKKKEEYETFYQRN